jgi:3-phenylpropionate/trans-cinnamate dioxygenase ferredoxin reductase component
MTDRPRFVIVGAGHAGGRAAEAMRVFGFEGRILLIGDEPHLPYERPPLSKEALQGKPELAAPMRPAGFWAEKDIECRLGTRAVAIDPAAKTVTLDDGSIEAYDKLLLTTGGAVRTLAVPGADLGNVFTLRTLDDSRAIDAALTPDARVVVIGGGFIGLETAASARLRGCAVTVIELADRLMARAVLPEISETFLKLHRERGVDVRLKTGVARLDGGRAVDSVVTRDGTSLPADTVVVGVGIVPDAALAEAAGLAVDDGIVVDAFCRASAPDVFAAGDVTRHFSPVYGRHVRLESWQNAQNQAIAAARVMCGEETPHAEVPWMWSDQFDARLEVAGLPERWDSVVVRGDPDGRDYMLFQMDGGRPVGAMSVNQPRDMRFARRLLLAEKEVDPAALADMGVSMRDLAR